MGYDCSSECSGQSYFGQGFWECQPGLALKGKRLYQTETSRLETVTVKKNSPRDANIIIQLCHNSCKNSKPGCVFVRSRVRRGLGGALDRRVHKRKNWRQCHCDLEARSLRLCRRHCNSAGLHHTGAESAASSRYSKGKSGHVWLRVRLKTPDDLMETPWFRLLCWWGLNAWMTAGKTLGSPYN